jgi:hypothetical protein
MSPSLWNRNFQNARVFDWAELLEEWNDSLNMPRHVQTFINNLQAASRAQHGDPADYPLSHFLTFLNNEQDGLKWFAYEIVAMRWMWGESRLDYLRQLVDRIDQLDSGFPQFPGRPNGTVRQYLETHLSPDELEYVNMMPQLITARQQYTPPFRRQASAPPLPPRVQRAPPQTPIQVPPPLEQDPVEIRFIRPADVAKTERNKDTIITVRPAGSDKYRLYFREKALGNSANVVNLTRHQVLQRLSLMFRLTLDDEDGYRSVQVTVPGMPSVLFRISSLSSNLRDMVYDMVEMTMEAWPETV